MCGIVAGIWPKGEEPTPDAFERALDAIAHRGPDGRGTMRFDYGTHIGLIGHVRLAHVDLAGGAQPIVVGKMAYAVNGEIYGHQAQRAALEAKGRIFKTRSDSEIPGHLIEDAIQGGGSKFPEDLRGEWCMAILSTTEPRIMIECDAAGTKPLRFHVSDDSRSIMVASEAKALFALGAPRRIDEEALRFAMQFQYLPFGRTLFDGVEMLPHAHSACFWPLQDGTMVGTVSPWTDPYRKMSHRSAVRRQVSDPRELEAGLQRLWPAEAEAFKAAPTPERQILTLLESAVSMRIPTETGFATHLSGGLDSTAILALAARATGRRDIPAFTASFPWGADEADMAEASARAIGARHVRVEMDAKRLTAAMDAAAWYAEGPAMNAHSGAKVLIAEVIRSEGLKCALTGEGADEAFYGYEHLRLDLFGPGAADGLAKATRGVHRPDGNAPEITADRFGLPVPTFVKAKAGMGIVMKGAFGERLRATADPTAQMESRLPSRWRIAMRHRSDVQVARDLWSTYCLSGYILRGLDDACGMARSVESRLPFLDPGLQWAAERITPHKHFAGRNGIEKHVLRGALRGIVPEDVLSRPKAPFMAPHLTQTPEGAAWARERILGGRLASSRLYGAEGLEAILGSPDSPKREACVTTLATLSAIMEAFDLE